MDVSVIIPTRNRRQLVLRAVGALLERWQTDRAMEIIVSADRCTDGTERAIAAAHGNRVSVVTAQGPGPSGAINTAMRRATGSLAVLMDDDVEPDAGFVQAHADAHEQPGGRSMVLVGRLTFTPRTSLGEYLAAAYANFYHALEEGRMARSPRAMAGGNCSISMSDLRAVGGFNERYAYARNDFELACRLLERGAEFVYEPRASGTSELPESGSALIDRAAGFADADVRLAREHRWCMTELPLYRSPGAPRTRATILHSISGALAPAFRVIAAGATGSLSAFRTAYAAAYWSSVRNHCGLRELRALWDAADRATGPALGGEWGGP